MFDQEDSDLGVVMGVVFGIIALVIAFVIGLGVYQQRSVRAAGPEVAAASVSAEDIFVEVDEVGEPLVKFYFDLGQTALPAGVPEVATVAAALAAAPAANVLLSGYHDETGGAAVNAEVARQRALSVRDALVGAGIPESRVLLRRPAVTLGGSDAAEARRVEARVQ